MDLNQYAALAAYWRRCPPTHLLLRAALGFAPQRQSAGDLSTLLAEAEPGGLFATPC
jgi:hypothetical protein